MTDERAAPPGRRPRAGARIEVAGLTKRFGPLTAVDDLSFSVEPGRITGFLGPNGAGKTTTLRMLLGLVQRTSGTATIGGQEYRDLQRPLETVGAALEATSFHPGRSGRNHLRVIAATHGLPDRRADELLDLVGIPAAARTKVGGYSLGMRQRLGLAAALLGDPQVLILDEPANGLDPQGIRWLRGFLRHLAADQGKTILVSSHMLSEVQATVDDVVIIANGRSVKQGPIASLRPTPRAVVRTTQAPLLLAALAQVGVTGHQLDAHTLEVPGGDPRLIGDTALAARLPVHGLTQVEEDLESVFVRLTEAPEHRSRNLAASPTPASPAGPTQEGQS